MQQALSYSCGCMAEVLVAMGKPEEAKPYFRENVEICEKLAAAEESVTNLDQLGTAYVEAASVEGGEEQCQLMAKAVSVYERLCAMEPQNQRFQSDLASLRDYLKELEQKNAKRGGFLKKLFGKN